MTAGEGAGLNCRRAAKEARNVAEKRDEGADPPRLNTTQLCGPAGGTQSRAEEEEEEVVEVKVEVEEVEAFEARQVNVMYL